MASSRLAGAVGDSSAGRQLTKWQTALLIGVPLAALSVAGVALFLYLRRRRGANNRPPSIEIAEEDGSATPVLPEERAVSEEGAGAEDKGADKEDEPPELVRCSVGNGCPMGIN